MAMDEPWTKRFFCIGRAFAVDFRLRVARTITGATLLVLPMIGTHVGRGSLPDSQGVCLERIER